MKRFWNPAWAGLVSHGLNRPQYRLQNSFNTTGQLEAAHLAWFSRF